ncbi:MAG: hypothetical protein IKU57_00885 [Oscillospiraceae bacterium]|nr:hypothetical protein [Oscillospiraceae bacterium]
MTAKLCPRPKTTKRYVHPPYSERMFTLWAEGKVIFGEHDFDLETTNIMEHRIHYRMMSCAMWPVLGKDLVPFDFRSVKNVITEDGAPIHGVSFERENVAYSMEVFCNSQRKSTLFGKITLQNTGTEPLQDSLYLMLRTNFECQLVPGKTDGYISHEPGFNAFKALPISWYQKGDTYTDQKRVFTLSVPAAWNASIGAVTINVDLAPGAELTFTFKLDNGEVADYNYEIEKANTIAFWQKELSRITKMPAGIAKDPAMVKAVRHMVAQLLQMFAVTIPENLHIVRQGAMQRAVWPTEALSVFEGLCRIGDFDDYLEPVFDTYFNTMQLPSGEIGALGIPWASMSAAVLYSLAQYCNTTKNKAFFKKYRDNAYRAFRYIKDLRRSVVDDEEIAGGLFPPLRGIDWPHQFQCWTSTDVFNLLGLDAIAATFKAYSDPVADEIRQEYTDYLADMKRHFKKFYDAQEGNDTLRPPLMPMGDDQFLVDDFYPLLYQGRFVFCGIVDNEKDMLRVYKYMIDAGITKEGLGLYGHMPYKNGNNNIWYLSFPDIYWFEIWMQYGYKEKAKEIIDAQLRYAMSEEYYFAERIDAGDPYYVPWSPNASATGRTLIMLSKYYA